MPPVVFVDATGIGTLKSSRTAVVFDAAAAAPASSNIGVRAAARIGAERHPSSQALNILNNREH